MTTLQYFAADCSHAKHVGRTLFHDSILWLALSGSGIEFDFQGKHLELLILGDDNASAADAPIQDKARIGVIIDGVRVIDDMVTAAEKKYTLIDTASQHTYHVQVIKLSEAPMSIVGIKQLITNSNATITPTPPKARLIEFIGDSITCGYGVDDNNLEHTFSTETEDVTKAYAYLTAQALQSDYSMVSYSGHGIISGYTESDEKLEDELVPPYYHMIGFSRGTYKNTQIMSADWDFSAFKPDLVVINLGTNDDSYCQDKEDRQEEFAASYLDFLKEIRKNNPDAVLLCTYGIMNQRLYPYIEKAVAAYKNETNDVNIHSLKFEMQQESDGYVVDYHPNFGTHCRSAWRLIQEIKEIMNW
ncbi:MAG: GDSL-type esterase/lipase family protein [Butyrivibrio sp.]|nr:GDSL-type esterase/lipase family protein [Butyrivibrio sp.]